MNGPMLVDLLEASEIGEIDVLVYYYTEKGVENSEFGGKYAPALQVRDPARPASPAAGG